MSSKQRRNDRYLNTEYSHYDYVPTFEVMVNEVRRLLRQSDLLDLSAKRVRTRFLSKMTGHFSSLQDLTSATLEGEEH